VDTVVHPDYRSQGVGGMLIEARYDLIRALNLRGLVAGSLPIDYYKVADTVSIDQYVRDVVAGRRFDTNLSKQLHKGFKVHSLIPHYSDSERSVQWGVEIVWHNPDYQPVRRAPIFALPRQYTFTLKPLPQQPSA
jgi:ribosomal protein S18 acetylase RimI-like enzyme